MPFGFVADVLGIGGGNDVEQTTTVDNVIENTFSPNVLVDVAIGGLDTLGGALRDGFSAITGQNESQTQSINQAGLNLSTAIDTAGVNVSNSLIGASENIEDGADRLGANIGFGLLATGVILTLGRRAFRA